METEQNVVVRHRAATMHFRQLWDSILL